MCKDARRSLIGSVAGALAVSVACGSLALAATAPPINQDNGLAGTKPYDKGLAIAFCPRHAPHHATARISTSHAGWPPDQCLKMENGRAGRSHTLVGLNGVHNYLLGGYGNDTIIGGDRGDVIWGDYRPNNKPSFQTATIRAGNGKNFIYANDTRNQVWTGDDPATVVHASDSGTSGYIHCGSTHVTVYLGLRSSRLFHLYGCHAVVS